MTRMNVQAAEHAQDARRLRSIETQLTALGLVDDDRRNLEAERARLRKKVPAKFMSDQREVGARADEKGIFRHEKVILNHGNEDGINGLSWRTRPAAMYELAAKVADEWKEKQEEERKRKEEEERERERVV